VANEAAAVTQDNNRGLRRLEFMNLLMRWDVLNAPDISDVAHFTFYHLITPGHLLTKPIDRIVAVESAGETANFER
jgi:hypothetical protein